MVTGKCLSLLAINGNLIRVRKNLAASHEIHYLFRLMKRYGKTERRFYQISPR